MAKIAGSAVRGFVFAFPETRHNISQSFRAPQLSDTYK